MLGPIVVHGIVPSLVVNADAHIIREFFSVSFYKKEY